MLFGLYKFGVKMKTNQRSSNPYKNSDTNKRYFTYDYYLRKTFGGKCAKIPIDAGFSCPNIDGRCGVGGCIYCSPRGSGDFAESCELSVTEQFHRVKSTLSSKWKVDRYIPYFQAHTNTYAPLQTIRDKYEQALAIDGVVALNTATRADCLEDGVVEYLAELAERTVLTVELGLQSSNDNTAQLINRGHTYEEFVIGYKKLRAASEKINICVHIIFGLPEETKADMLETVRDVAALCPDQVKIHLLHVLRKTRMGDIYLAGGYTPMTKEEYVECVADAIELLPPDTVVARVTGDGMADDLLAPEWSRKKVSVINDIDKLLYERNSYQGKKYKE